MKATYIFTCTSTYRPPFRSCTKSDLKSPSSEPTSSSKASSKGSSRSPWASQDQEWEEWERERENKLHSSSFYSSIIWNITVIPSSKIYIELEKMQKSVKYWNRQNIEDSIPSLNGIFGTKISFRRGWLFYQLMTDSVHNMCESIWTWQLRQIISLLLQINIKQVNISTHMYWYWHRRLNIQNDQVSG